MSHFPRPETDPGTILERNKRYYGQFMCDECNRYWTSGTSWLGSGQDCTRCGELTYPYKLSYLEPADGSGVNEKPHQRDKCERCKQLGHCCRSSEGVNVGQNRGRIVPEWTQEWPQESAQERSLRNRPNPNATSGLDIAVAGISILLTLAFFYFKG